MLYRFLHFLGFFVLHFLFFLRICGKNNYRQLQGGYIVICNHTSNWDPPILGYSVDKRPVRYMAKEELFRNKLASFLLHRLYAIPVSRGAGDISAVKKALSVLRAGDVLGIFPEGTRAYKNTGLGPFESGAALLALRANVPVVPAYIAGGYRLFHRVTVRFGEPVYLNKMFPEQINSAVIHKATAVLRDRVVALKQAATCKK